MRSNHGPCRACKAQMIWATMPSGKNNPLDVEPIPLETVLENHKGVIAYYAGNRHGLPLNNDNVSQAAEFAEKGATFHISHWATCPAKQRLREERDAGELRDCPVAECGNVHERSMLMCRPHWRKVPKPLQDDLWRAYREEGVLSEAYVAARDACIAQVETS